MSRPENMVGRKGLFTEEQVRAWREEYQERRILRAKLANTRTIEDMADEAGIGIRNMQAILNAEIYAWVR